MLGDPELMRKTADVWMAEKLRADNHMAYLGRGTAKERIARLIASIMDRIAARGVQDARTIDIPLRQHQIADVTGLTPVHVNKVMGEMRRSGMIEIKGRSLTVQRPAEFDRLAQPR